jgi:hypothetical protein
MKFKSKQEIFDYVVQKLIEQGGKSTSEGCAYRGDYGRKCPIGWLIPDEAYISIIEGMPWCEIVSHAETNATYSSVIKAVYDDIDPSSGVDNTFLSDMQIAHDDSDSDGWDAQMEIKLFSFAMKYDLDASVLVRDGRISSKRN